MNLTGAVDQVNPKLFKNRPVPNLAQGLVGVVPNLNLRMLDGKPTQSPAFNIRGTTSIGQGGSALVLIDGVEGDPRMLNPNDVESISVLKDAASASIYGARAAFGVVLITTKMPVAGKTSVAYSANYAIKSPTEVPDNITDSYPWAKAFSDAWSRWNDNGSTPTAINKTISFSPLTSRRSKEDGKILVAENRGRAPAMANTNTITAPTGTTNCIRKILARRNITCQFPGKRKGYFLPERPVQWRGWLIPLQ